MKSKRILAVIISTCLCMSTFVGCSLFSDSDTASTTDTSSNAAGTSTPGAPPSGTSTPGAPPSGTSTPGAPPSGTSAPGGSSSEASVTGTADYSVSNETTSKSGETYTATESNESGIIVNDGTLTLSDATINKTGGDTSSEDQSNFYGLNAALLAENGSQVTVSGTKINTSADGSNGVFSTGDGTVLNISDSTITTTENSSRGLDATMGGTINATNVTINTAGAHCASIATDRGGGTVNVNGGTMTTTGQDSPGIYSTGNITASDAQITATGAEAAVVEGKNSITLNNVNIAGEKTNGVMLYQSTSGDAETGTASFTMTNGSLSSKAGSLFFITNTDAVASIKNVAITNSTDTLIDAAATERWGTSGENGGKFAFTADTETLAGKVICDKISSVTMTLKNNTTFTGSINTDNSLANVTISLDSTSKWDVNADSYVLALTDSDTTLANIQSNGHTIYYDSTNSANSWLNGKTITLSDGGKLAPLS